MNTITFLGGRAATLGRGAAQRDNDSRPHTMFLSASEKGKRKKPAVEDGGAVDDGQTRPMRTDSYRRGGMRGGQHNVFFFIFVCFDVFYD